MRKTRKIDRGTPSIFFQPCPVREAPLDSPLYKYDKPHEPPHGTDHLVNVGMWNFLALGADAATILTQRSVLCKGRLPTQSHQVSLPPDHAGN